MEIRVFRTHIVCFPYFRGQNESLEKRLSKYDRINFRFDPIGYYIDEEQHILYLPRGVSLNFLQLSFNAFPVLVSQSSKFSKIQKYKITTMPKNKIQEDAISFLTSQNQFTNGRGYSQLGLNLDTGDGKTFATIAAILSYRLRSIIITHKDSLKEQWIEEFVDKTTIPEDRILNITNSSVIEKIMKGNIPDYDIFMINHQTLYSYAKTKSWHSVYLFFEKIRVGIKVYDEAHKFFSKCLMVDFFSNVEKTFYLTATFGRSVYDEDRIYKEAYSSVYRFGEETYTYEEKRKHIVFVPIFYSSNASDYEISKTKTKYGFSSYKFIDYALKDENHSLLKVLDTILSNVFKLEGRIIIISPKIETVDFFCDYVQNKTERTVSSVHGKRSKEDNRNARKTSDIISTTIKNMGEGDNIKGVRVLINLDPIGSSIAIDQLRGRLREYAKDMETFLFYPIDISFPSIYASYCKNVEPVMKKKCKKIIKMRLHV